MLNRVMSSRFGVLNGSGMQIHVQQTTGAGPKGIVDNHLDPIKLFMRLSPVCYELSGVMP